jgi:hypothetical protein
MIIIRITMNNKCKILSLFFIVIGITTTVEALRKKTTPEDEQKTSLSTEKLKLAKKIANTRNTLKRIRQEYFALKAIQKRGTLSSKEKQSFQDMKAVNKKKLKDLSRIVGLMKQLSQMEDEFKEMAKVKPVESAVAKAMTDKTTITEEKTSTEASILVPTAEK